MSYSISGRAIVCSDGRCTEPLASESWMSAEGVVWKSMLAAQSPFHSRSWGACGLALVDSSVFLFAGRDDVAQLNDVWRSSDFTRTWQLVTDNAAWSDRAEAAHFTVYNPILRRELWYAAGEGAVHRYNDVWVSSDQNKSWLRLTEAAAWSAWWGTGAAVSKAGLMFVFGGADAQGGGSSDLWLSMDAGLSFHVCASSLGPHIVNRSEATLFFDRDDRLILAGGYNHSVYSRTQLYYDDVYISNATLSDLRAVSEWCGLPAPSTSAASTIGLPCWPTASNVPACPPPSAFGTLQLVSVSADAD